MAFSVRVPCDEFVEASSVSAHPRSDLSGLEGAGSHLLGGLFASFILRVCFLCPKTDSVEDWAFIADSTR